ncbi:MAG TPA: peptidylprolyl isomerase [Anaerolineales bacterium]
MANPSEQKPVLHTKKHMARLERERRQTRYILAGFILILVAVVGLIAYAIIDQTYLQPRRPVATVGDVAIPLEEWKARVRMERQRMLGNVNMYEQYQQYLGVDLSSQIQQMLAQLNNPVSIGQTVLDDMINEEIIRQESAKRGITASAAEVEQAIQASFQYYPSGTPTASVTPTNAASPTLSAETLKLVTITPTPTEFQTPLPSPTATLDPLISPTASTTPSPTATSGPTPTELPTSTPFPTSTPITQQGYEESYRTSVDNLTKQGLTEVQLRQLYEVDILRRKLRDLITVDVPHTQEQVWARHILVPDESIAQVVRDRLDKGEDFAKLAAELSTDTSNKDKGGDLGWFARGAMVAEFENAAFSLKVGEISQPVKTQFGYHIIQVLAHANMPLDASGYDNARQTAFDKWLTEARTTYNVVTQDFWHDLVPTEPTAPPLAQ